MNKTSRKSSQLGPEQPLTARDVQEALEERISTGHYPLGSRLPPVRYVAAEFGTSPSTVSRALQEMMRNGWLEVHERRFVRVRDQLPSNVVRSADIQRSARAIAHKWKLWGGSQDELMHTLTDIVQEVFKARSQLVFTECNANDLEQMGDQLARELPDIPLKRQLITDLHHDDLARDGAVIVVPYYHYAEVRDQIGEDLPIVPIHFKPSVGTLDKLVTIRPGSHVLVFGRNQRSVDRLSLIVQEYVDAVITGLTMDQRDRVAKVAKSADAIVTAALAVEALPKLDQGPPVIEVRFELESSLRNKFAQFV